MVNTLFRRLLWNAKPPRIKLEKLQHSKDSGGLAILNAWLYYIAAQLQHLVGSVSQDPVASAVQLLLFASEAKTIPMGLEAQLFLKSNKQPLTLRQKIWNKSRKLQGVQGFTNFSPIWGNRSYVELAKLQQGSRWHAYGVALLSHIFSNGKLLSLTELRAKFNLAATMFYSYLQLRHTVAAQGDSGEWALSPTPVFHVWHTLQLRGSCLNATKCYLQDTCGHTPVRQCLCGRETWVNLQGISGRRPCSPYSHAL